MTVVGYGVVHFGKDADANRRIFEFAKALGVQYLSADPDPASFDGLDKLVEKFDIAVGIHNHGPGHRYDKIETIASGDQGPPSQDRLLRRHRPFPPLEDRPGGRRRGVRQAGLRRPLERRQGRQDLHRPGQGRSADGRSLKALARNKYSYCLAIEYEEKPENPVDDIKACLAEAARAIAEVRKA